MRKTHQTGNRADSMQFNVLSRLVGGICKWQLFGDNFAFWLWFEILARERAAPWINPASNLPPWVEVLVVDQLGEGAEEESNRAGDVHHGSHGHCRMVLQFLHPLGVLRISAQKSESYHADDEDGEVEEVNEEELIPGHLDVCSD